MKMRTLSIAVEKKMNSRLLSGACRILAIGAGAALLIGASARSGMAANDTTIQICVDRVGHISGIQTNCRRNQTVLNWNIPGPVGPQGYQGGAGPQGVQGPVGPLGPQGSVGPVGNGGPKGAMGPTGPTGPQGATGDPGPRGNTGPTGDQGPTGPKGITGNPGHVGTKGNTPAILTGGDLGNANSVAYGIQLTSSNTASSPLYLGPMNGASASVSSNIASVQVPLPAGSLTSFIIHLNADVTTGSYQFVACKGGICPALPMMTCTIATTSDTCTSTGGPIAFNNGDTLAIQAVAVGSTNSVDLSWSASYTVTPPM